MSGPWEDYQAAPTTAPPSTDGPWSDYAAPSAPAAAAPAVAPPAAGETNYVDPGDPQITPAQRAFAQAHKPGKGTGTADDPLYDYPDRPSRMDAYRVTREGKLVAPEASAVRALAEARAANRNNDDIGRTVAAAGQGATLGFGDELTGLAAGAGTGLRNLVAHTGLIQPAGYSAAEAAQATTQATREDMQGFHDRRPILDTTAQIAGGLLAPGVGESAGFIRGASTLAGAAGRSAIVGGAYGAAAGAGNAQGGLLDRGQGALVGGGIGAALGAATPLAVRTSMAATKGLYSTVRSGIVGAGRAVGSPGATVAELSPAAKVTAERAARDHVATIAAQGGVTPDMLEANAIEAAGKPITAAEALGRSGTYQLGALGRRAGGTADPLEGMLTTRLVDRSNRMLSDVEQHLGVASDQAQGDVEAITAAGQKRVAPMFDAARATPGPIMNEDLSRLAKRPVIKRAISAAYEDILNDGRNPEDLGFFVKPGKRIGFETGIPPEPDVIEVKTPTAEAWDLIRKRVGSQVELHPLTRKIIPDSASPGNYNINQASRGLTAALREAIPGYGEALDASGDYLSVRGAFERISGKLTDSRTSAAAFDRTLNGMTAGEKEAAKAAIANDLYRLQQNGRLRPGVLKTPAVRAKLESAFGAERARNFINAAEQEVALDKGYRMTPGTNSVTGETVIGDAGNTEGLDAAQRALRHASHGGVKSALYKYTVDRAFAGLRNARTPVTQAARDEAGRLLMLKPSELAAVLRTHGNSAPVSRGEAAAVGLLGRGAGGTVGGLIGR